MVKKTESDFELFISQLQETNRTLGFFCDFDKIGRNVDEVRLNLCSLDFLIGAEDMRKAVEIIFKRDKRIFDVLGILNGKVGTPKRDTFESDVDGALHAYRLGEAIKKARIEQNLTQEQLGERIGVKRVQISRLERGYSITIPTMRRVFKALGVVTATIDLGIAGKVSLW